MAAKGITLAEEGKLVNVIAPVDISGGALTGRYVNMKNYAHVTFTILMGVVTNDVLIKVLEATSAAGGSATAIAFASYQETAVAGDTLGARTATGVGGIQTGTNNSTTLVIEVDASQLSDGSPWVTILTDNAGNALISVTAVLTGSRFASGITPTVLA